MSGMEAELSDEAPPPAGDHHETDTRDVDADVREDEADQREAAADERELRTDARERVLDRWERDIAARAASLHQLGVDDDRLRERQQHRREHDRLRRRDDADARRSAAIERDIERAERGLDGAGGTPEPGAAGPAGFVRLVVGARADPPLDEVMDLILTAAIDTVPGCAGGSIALAVTGQLQTAATTGRGAAALDGAQLDRRCGPLPTAAEGDAVVTDNLMADERWPRLADLPRSNAARGAMSFGLLANGTPTGVLTLYAALGTSFTDRAVGVGDLLAAHATVTLGRTIERMEFDAQSDAWQRALESRDAIGQAKGILMEQRAVSADEAFRLLRDASQVLNIKLRDVAEHVVEQRRLPDVS